MSTITVDSYSTLVDVDAAETALSRHVSNPEPISNCWRSRSLLYTMVGNVIGAYQPFYEMNRDALQYALDVHGVDVSPEERDDILAVYHELDVFDDVRGGIERIRDAGCECYVVSNGNPEMLDSLVTHADIGDVITDTISADEIEVYKPAPQLYRHAAARTGTPIDEIAHVSAGWLDVQGAKHAGMQGVWLNRTGAPWEPLGGEPTLTVTTFHEFADELDG